MTALRLIIWVGGTALVAGMAANVAGVAGRLTGLAVHGTIEVVQACIALAGGIAILVATARFGHARIRLLVDRLGSAQAAVERLSELAIAAFLALLLAGGVWLAADLWSAHEVSDVLDLPWRALRLAINLALAAATILALAHAVGRRP